jgi:hypothetical protein
MGASQEKMIPLDNIAMLVIMVGLFYIIWKIIKGDLK